MIGSKQIGVFLSPTILLLIVWQNCNLAIAADTSSGLTHHQAASLAVLVVRHQIEGIKHKGDFSLDGYYADQEPDPRFYTFEALGIWSAEGSAVIGNYSVNRNTGDVWDLFTCKKVEFTSLRKLRESYFHAAAPRSSEMKPVLCDF